LVVRGRDPDTRNRFHETALREARVASEYRKVERVAPAQPRFVARLRLAFAGPAATEACNCPT
jgi:hypothetical protein